MSKDMLQVHKENTALLVIDVQKGLFERATPIYKAEAVLESINTLICEARGAEVPVIFIQHSNENTLVSGSNAWELHPQIQPSENEMIIHKRYGNAFESTDLHAELTGRNVDTLVITGLVTHGCVRATCLGAIKMGYQVILVSDGHSNFSKDAPKLIEKWNKTLHKKGADLRAAKDLEFVGA